MRKDRPCTWTISGLIILRKPDLKFLFDHPANFIALGFGAGLAPKAPGTVGSLVAFPLWGVLILLPSAVCWGLVVAGFVGGIWVCAKAAHGLGKADHGGIVWDEIVAMVAVLLMAPAGWMWWIAAFVCFRIFDIWKPFPISYFDRTLKGGFGVMFDDLLAAIYAVAVLRTIEQILIRGLV